MPLTICDICRTIWGASLQVVPMGQARCCVCDAERACMGPVSEQERDEMLGKRASGKARVA